MKTLNEQYWDLVKEAKEYIKFHAPFVWKTMEEVQDILDGDGGDIDELFELVNVTYYDDGGYTEIGVFEIKDHGVIHGIDLINYNFYEADMDEIVGGHIFEIQNEIEEFKNRVNEWNNEQNNENNDTTPNE